MLLEPCSTIVLWAHRSVNVEDSADVQTELAAIVRASFDR